jgi:hypothetical protein
MRHREKLSRKLGFAFGESLNAFKTEYPGQVVNSSQESSWSN